MASVLASVLTAAFPLTLRPAGAVGLTPGTPTWSVSAQYPSGTVTSLTGVSCPTAADCVAVQGNAHGAVYILTTSNGGTTWASQAVPSGVYDLTGVSCASTTDCVAVGDSYDPTSTTYAGVVIATTDGGVTWVAASVPSGVWQLAGVSCASSSDCFAVGVNADPTTPTAAGVILATTDGGTTWTSQAVPSGVEDLYGVSCPSTTTCVAGGYVSTGGAILATINGGTTWTSQAVPSAVYDVNALSGLTEMMGTRHPRKVVMTRKNGRDCPNEACYYASL